MRILACAVAFACLAAALAPAWGADRVDVTGEWEITIQTSEGTFTPTAAFQQEGEKLSGTYQGRLGESKIVGSVKEKAIQWKVTFSIQGQMVDFVYRGTVESNTAMKGSVDFGDFGSAEWTAKRKPKEK